MEDMKKMIERYKRELLEYSKINPESSVSVQPPEARQSETQQTDSRKKPSIIGYISEDAKKELEKTDVPQELIESVAAQDTNTAENTDTAVIPSEDEETVTYELPGGELRIPAGELDNARANASDNTLENANSHENSDETFDKPMFTQVPSFDETREQITEQSVPKENKPSKNTSGVTDNLPTAKRAEFGNNERVSDEKAERLTEQPISGQSPDEQLTGRNFEDGRMTQNNPDDALQQNGSGTKPIDFTEAECKNVEEFEEHNRGSGTILFRVYTAREALPIENAVCTITKTFDGKPHVFYTLVTDESGRTSAVLLPAPSKELSQDPDNRIQPFALYDATVTRNGFAEVIFKEIPVFDGVSSVQQVGMIPVPEINEESEGTQDAR